MRSFICLTDVFENGLVNPNYISSILNKLDFNKYYQGTFKKSFNDISNILKKSKFMVDLSQLPNDGGGNTIYIS